MSLLCDTVDIIYFGGVLPVISSTTGKIKIFGGSLLFIAGYIPSILNFSSPIKESCDIAYSIKSIPTIYTGHSIRDFIPLSKTNNVDYMLSKNDKFFNSEFLRTNTLQQNNRIMEAISPDSSRCEQTNLYCDAIEQKAGSIIIADIGEFVDARIVTSKINVNFYTDARNLGIPPIVIDSVAKVLSEKIDFRRSLKSGDTFEIIYSRQNELLYAKIKTKRNNISVYRMQTGKSAAYYFANGEQAQRQIAGSNTFGNPLPGKLTVSDKFGHRIHPITKKYSNHTGVDLRASYGTPVYAIHDGIVKRSSRYAGYGNCVDIQHKSGYSSRYAHLSKITTKTGNYVKKGQIIGHVGSTGSSTGPHLHLELARYNRVMNPMHVKMMQITKSTAINRVKFNNLKNSIHQTLEKLKVSN